MKTYLSVWTYYGRQPTFKEMSKHPSLITGKSYVSCWGSWTKSLIAFVEKVNSDIENEEFDKIDNSEIKESKPKKQIPKSEQREVSLGLRYDILKRDIFKCVLCGKSPATDLNCKLQVDHIIAWTNGGKTVKENLQTLCSDCNNGKSDKE